MEKSRKMHGYDQQDSNRTQTFNFGIDFAFYHAGNIQDFATIY
jgi:hypothetical protein